MTLGSPRSPVRAGQPGDLISTRRKAFPRIGAFTLAVMMLAGVALAGVTVQPAHASDDRIDDFSIRYRVARSGKLHVREKIVWRFGSDSGRHGIKRNLITRAPDADNKGKDMVYDISNFRVSSPTGQSSDFTKRKTGGRHDRTRSTEYKIGDPDKRIGSDTATYVLHYDVSGAMRSSSDYDELYWNATGSDNPKINKVAVDAKVPGGPRGVKCYAGKTGSTNTCDHTDKTSQAATFRHSGLPAGQNMTVAVKIKSGLISDNKPHLEPDASHVSSAERVRQVVTVGVGVLLAAIVPVAGWLMFRSKMTDLRYIDLPPGTFPPAGSQSRVGKNDKHIQIPVAFAPPNIPVAEAGQVIDGQVDSRDTAATIVDLAVRGVIKIEEAGDSGDNYRLRLLDPGRLTAPHEVGLLNNLFGGAPPGAVVDLSGRGSMLSSHKAMIKAVRQQVRRRRWFTAMPKRAGKVGFGVAIIWAILFFVLQAGFHLNLTMVAVLIPIVSLLITWGVISKKLGRGQRTPDGRAVTDQVEGFKQYLATAEADQLRFEEGEDIFSRYLPWAIAFDLAQRWSDLCNELVAEGRLADEAPHWYAGGHGFHFGAFNAGFLSSSLASASTSAGGSGGSAFGGGGGFSGGGGGGGGSSSW